MEDYEGLSGLSSNSLVDRAPVAIEEGYTERLSAASSETWRRKHSVKVTSWGPKVDQDQRGRESRGL